LFVTGSLRQLVPDDHILARVDRVLDLSWLRAEVADLSCADNGRPGIDPEVAVRLMLAGFLLGLVHDRRLMREAQVNLAIRWFVGDGLHETLADHSSLTRIRQRWGPERFKAILTRSVQACVAAGIAKGEGVHIDRCPRGRTLRGHPDADGFQADRAMVKDGAGCPLRARGFSPSMKRTAILLHKDHPALIRARRKHLAWGTRDKAIYASHRGRVEGVHGQAKTWHGLARAVRRGLGTMQIQAYLTAPVINLKRLVAALLVVMSILWRALALDHRHAELQPA
jgi:transposase